MTSENVSPASGLARKSLLELLHHLINGEAGCFLTRRELLECSQEVANDALGGHNQEDVVHKPIPVRVRGHVGTLEWVSAQVEKLRYAQGGEGFEPDL